jgi:hypothetical protein
MTTSARNVIPLVTIIAADDLFLLSNAQLSAFTPSAELSSARLTTILDRTEVGWPAGARDISTGSTTLGNYPIAEGTNALQYLRNIDSAERGRIFVRASDGDLVFEPRIGIHTLGPGGHIRRRRHRNPIPRSLRRLHRRIGTEPRHRRTHRRHRTDRHRPASIALYFTQAETITGSLLSTDAQALTLAGYLTRRGTRAPFLRR